MKYLLLLIAATAFGQPRYFANIQTYQVRPITGSTYSLGTTGARWTNFFTDRITLTTGAGFGFTSAIHPSADATFDIGSVASGNFRFKDLFLSGALNAFSLDLNAGNAITGALRPTTGSTYSLGTTGARWNNFFTDRIVLSDTAGLGFTSNLYPSADNTYNFGTAAYRWASANIAGTATTGSILSQLTSTHSLGSTGNRWVNVFTDNLTLTTGFRLGTIATAGHVLTADASGNGTYQAAAGAPPFTDTGALIKGSVDATKLMNFEVDGFTTLTTRTLTPQNASYTIAGLETANVFTVDQTMNSNLTVRNVVSGTSSTYNLGSTGNRWANTFFDRIVVSAGFGVGVGSELTPSADGVYNLGSASAKWGTVNAGTVTATGTVNTATLAASGLVSANASLNVTGTTTLTGSLQFDTDALRNIGSSVIRANQAWMSQSRATAYYYNGTLGLTQVLTAGTCVMTFTTGGLTAAGAGC